VTVHNDRALGRARRRVARIRGFYVHLITYLVVNSLLATIDLIAGTTGDEVVIGLDWAYWSIIFWGVIVVADAVTTFVLTAVLNDRWEQRRLDHYMRQHHPSH